MWVHKMVINSPGPIPGGVELIISFCHQILAPLNHLVLHLVAFSDHCRLSMDVELEGVHPRRCELWNLTVAFCGMVVYCSPMFTSGGI